MLGSALGMEPSEDFFFLSLPFYLPLLKQQQQQQQKNSKKQKNNKGAVTSNDVSEK